MNYQSPLNPLKISLTHWNRKIGRCAALWRHAQWYTAFDNRWLDTPHQSHNSIRPSVVKWNNWRSGATSVLVRWWFCATHRLSGYCFYPVNLRWNIGARPSVCRHLGFSEPASGSKRSRPVVIHIRQTVLRDTHVSPSPTKPKNSLQFK